ncbi:MAG: PEGA domain-containing protein [Lachnospiraceae bacterium]|nr:PEGA domain-containing protein [Lachnospiraceae bacterium]
MKLKRYLGYILIISALLLMSSACNQKTNAPRPESTGKVTESVADSFQGVVKAVDTGMKEITFVNFNYGSDMVLRYSDASSVYNKGGSLTTPESLEAGLVVQVQYDSGAMKVNEIRANKDSWEYDNIVKWSVDTEKYMFSISDKNYMYSDSVLVLNDGKTQDIMCLNRVDKLKVFGIDNKICAIIVKEGHGYIRPSNYGNFVGGTVSVSYIMNQPVVENMLLVVREGIYEVTMNNGDLSGKRTVQVLRDEETDLDMSGVVAAGAADEGRVEFDIWPPGTDVYVNGQLIDYNEPLTLKYGRHSVTAALTGYTTYKGTLTVSSPNPTVKIDLQQEVAEIKEEDDDEDKKPTSKPSGENTGTTDKPAESTPAVSNTDNTSLATASPDNNKATGDESEIQYDKKHTMSVNAPEGAEVYLNGVYKGIAPCSFPKQIGTQTISLSKEGCTTRSYTVVINDDEQDVTWTFPELVSN